MRSRGEGVPTKWLLCDLQMPLIMTSDLLVSMPRTRSEKRDAVCLYRGCFSAVLNSLASGPGYLVRVRVRVRARVRVGVRVRARARARVRVRVRVRVRARARARVRVSTRARSTARA